MNIVEALQKVGPENIQIQELNKVMLRGEVLKKGARITFQTLPELAQDMNRCICLGGTPKKFGLIIWVDSEAWKKVVAK